MSAGSAGANSAHARHRAGWATLRLERARLSELSLVWRLSLACFPDTGLSYAVLGQYLTGRNSIILIVRQGLGLAGFVVLRLARDRGRPIGAIVSLGVDPAHRGTGIGRCLLQEAHRWCRESGAERVRLEVAEDNAPALSLYRSQGYRVVCRLLNYYGVGRDGLRMERPAPPRCRGGKSRGGKSVEGRPDR